MEILSFLFPKKCLECGLAGRYICASCIKKVPPGGWHGPNTYSIWRYKGVVRQAIIALKYKFATGITNELVEVCISALKEQRMINIKNFTLVSIPLHRKRENFRGFNQAELMGGEIAKKMGWEFAPDLLVRTKLTTPQVQLQRVDRHRNLLGAFAVNSKHRSCLVDNCPLVIFDDVFTTGSTLNEAVKVLTQAGFDKILTLTMAR